MTPRSFPAGVETIAAADDCASSLVQSCSKAIAQRALNRQASCFYKVAMSTQSTWNDRDATLRTVFISYASPDRDEVLPYAKHLLASGLSTWMDVDQIKPGQDWDFEIRKALDRASVIVVFLSSTSVSRRGYAQREIKLALKRHEESLLSDAFLIPVLLDQDHQVPEQLQSIQHIKSWEGDPFAKLVEAVSLQFESLGTEVSRVQADADVSWHFSNRKEERNGIPG
jgi:hypothetical protein